MSESPWVVAARESAWWVEPDGQADPPERAQPLAEPVADPPPAAESRSVGLVVRLTPAEREAWHAAAREAGRGKTAAWVREVVSERLEGGAPVGRGPDPEVARVRAELARIGSNINQLTYQVNAGALGGPAVQAAMLRQPLDRVLVELGAIRDALRERTSS